MNECVLAQSNINVCLLPIAAERQRQEPTREQQIQDLMEHFKARAENPPVEALPWSGLWEEYTEEMREIENQLRALGVVL